MEAIATVNADPISVAHPIEEPSSTIPGESFNKPVLFVKPNRVAPYHQPSLRGSVRKVKASTNPCNINHHQNHNNLKTVRHVHVPLKAGPVQMGLQCPLCECRYFYKQSQLDEHLECHMEPNPPGCKACSGSFRGNSSAQKLISNGSQQSSSSVTQAGSGESSCTSTTPSPRTPPPPPIIRFSSSSQSSFGMGNSFDRLEGLPMRLTDGKFLTHRPKFYGKWPRIRGIGMRRYNYNRPRLTPIYHRFETWARFGNERTIVRCILCDSSFWNTKQLADHFPCRISPEKRALYRHL